MRPFAASASLVTNESHSFNMTRRAMNLIREIILTDARFLNASTEIYFLSYVRFWSVSQLFYNLQLGQAFGWKVYSTIINESSLGNSVRSFNIVINNVLLIIYKYKYHGKVLSLQLCWKPPASLTQHKTLHSRRSGLHLLAETWSNKCCHDSVSKHCNFHLTYILFT